MFLQSFQLPHVPGEGRAGTVDDNDLTIMSTGQSATHHTTSSPREDVAGAVPSTGGGTHDHVEHGEEEGAEEINIDVTIPAFPGSSRVRSMGTLDISFLVDENQVPVKIEKIPGISIRLF